MVSQHIWGFFLCIIIPHKSKWIEDTELIILDFKGLDYCSGLCCFGVPVGCMPAAREFDYLYSCKEA